MKVLVAGASGFIGSGLCDALLARGDSVAGFSRDPQRARGTNPGVVWHRWEPTLERPPASAFEGVDGVVNLVGESLDQRWTEERKQRIMDSRRVSTHNLAQAIEALERRPRVLVNQSAVGLYGDRGEAMVDESGAPGDAFDARVIAEWERAAREVESAGVRLVLLRSGPVLHPSSGMLAKMLTPFRLGVGGPVAGGKQYVAWIHLEDEVGLMLWALDQDSVHGVINATAPNPVTNRELSKALGRALGRPAVVPVPGAALDVMFGREFGEILRGGQRVIPRRALDAGYEFRYPELDAALGDLLR